MTLPGALSMSLAKISKRGCCTCPIASASQFAWFPRSRLMMSIWAMLMMESFGHSCGSFDSSTRFFDSLSSLLCLVLLSGAFAGASSEEPVSTSSRHS
jgi:hypothetical protein